MYLCVCVHVRVRMPGLVVTTVTSAIGRLTSGVYRRFKASLNCAAVVGRRFKASLACAVHSRAAQAGHGMAPHRAPKL